MLVIPNYPSKCDIISASGASDVLGWESQEPFSSPVSNSVAKLEAVAQRLAVGSLQNPRLGREEIQEIAAENGFDQKNCHSMKPGIELNIGTQSVQEDFFRKRKIILTKKFCSSSATSMERGLPRNLTCNSPENE